MVKAFYAYIIIKIPAPLVLSVNSRYTGLVRAGIRYGKIMGGKTKGVCPLFPGNYRSFKKIAKKIGLFHILNICTGHF